LLASICLKRSMIRGRASDEHVAWQALQCCALALRLRCCDGDAVMVVPLRKGPCSLLLHSALFGGLCGRGSRTKLLWSNILIDF
jgi:hypothetical protein